MLTARGWWFLVAVLALLSFVAMASESALLVVALTLLLWFFAEWTLFAFRAWILFHRLRIVRIVQDERGAVDAFWSGRTFRVSAELRVESWVPFGYVHVTDSVPFDVDLLEGTTSKSGAISRDKPLTCNWTMRCRHPGRVRFEGMRLEMADLQGFFHHIAFVSAPTIYRVLPPLADAEGNTPAVKRHNILPSPGLHRHRRPGSGSELLDLRDYLPGDPPKTIAWKVSARRDRLITKEFESEVPLRCTLFVDTSQAVRVGPVGRNPLARLTEIAAAVAQATAANRDLAGLCLFDEQQVTSILRPARGRRHLLQVMNVLADAVALAPTTGEARVPALLPLAYATALELYPHLLRPGLNQVPFWLPWLWSQPALTDKRTSWLRTPIPLPILSRMSAERRRRAVWRKRLASLLAARERLGPAGIARLLEDDEAFALSMQHFLAEHQVPYPVPLHDRRGRYLFASPGKVEVLARTLLQSIARGRDNELFVLLADLLDLADDLEPLLRAVKVALARHHQICVVCPWPPGLPAPGVQPEPPPTTVQDSLLVELRELTAERLQRAYQGLRRQLGRLGVTVLCAQQQDSVSLILDRLDRLRLAGRLQR